MTKMKSLKVQMETITVKFLSKFLTTGDDLKNFGLENHQKVPKIRADTETLKRFLALGNSKCDQLDQ